ncbi:MAG TPA: hypothetical protein VLJ37_10680 [bacterium]|nr:hypothetical protein [bacterium]
MNRRENGLHYDFVGIRDRGDGVIGPTDLIIVRDEDGARHEYYLGDDQARRFLRGMGTEVEEIEGLPWGQAQSRLAYLHHMRCAMRKAQAGDAAGLDEELRQAEECARMAEMNFDMEKAQEVRSLLSQH